MPVTLELALLIESGTTPFMTPRTQRSVLVSEGRQIQHLVSLVIHVRSKLSLAFLLALLMFKNQINHNNKHPPSPAPSIQYYRIMGNEQANETSISLTQQDREDWYKVEEQGFCEIWANKKTGKRFQAYPISEAIAKDKVQVEKYVFRKLHGSTLVSAEAIVSQDQAFLCSEPSFSFVLIENIVNRLRNFSRCFSFEEVLYILSTASSGFNTLSSFFGPLEPNQDMICFNDEGKVKVWLNENLYKNEASMNAKAYDADLNKGEDYNAAQRRSKQCVDKLFRITEASASSPFPQDFKEEIKNFSTFFQISNFIEFYSQQKGIRVPEKVQLKREIAAMIPSRPVQNTIIYSSRPSIQLSNLESSRVKQVFQPVSSQKINFPSSFVSQSRTLQTTPVTFTVGPPLQNHKVSIVYPCSQTTIIPQVAVNQKIESVSLPQPPKIQEKREEKIQVIESSVSFVPVVEQKPIVVFPVEQKQPKKIQQINKTVQILQVKEQPQIVQQQIQKTITFNEQPQILVNYTQYHEQAQKEVDQAREEVYSQPQAEPEPAQSNWRQQPKQTISESLYSQIQSYIPPVRQPEEHPIIDETKEEDYPSPKKQSNQIDEWEERLNKFTNSQHIQQREQVFNISSREVKEQVHTEQPESFKNLKVTTQKEEYVNELADLQSDDIEKYIRMKYQSYINEKSEPIESSHKEEYNYEERPIERVEVKRNSYTYEPQNEDYTSYYKPYEYKETAYEREQIIEKENYPSDYRYEPKLSYDNRISIQQDFPQYSSRRNSGQYNYEKSKPLANDYSSDYRQSNSLKAKKSSRNSQVIDEKYSKYVLNSQKPPKSPSFIKPLEEVSLILPQDESFIQNRSYIPAPIYEKSGEGSILSKNSQRKGITYQKLRNLLWQD